jgi:hypothetical protein
MPKSEPSGLTPVVSLAFRFHWRTLWRTANGPEVGTTSVSVAPAGNAPEGEATVAALSSAGAAELGPPFGVLPSPVALGGVGGTTPEQQMTEPRKECLRVHAVRLNQ